MLNRAGKQRLHDMLGWLRVLQDVNGEDVNLPLVLRHQILERSQIAGFGRVGKLGIGGIVLVHP